MEKREKGVIIKRMKEGTGKIEERKMRQDENRG